MFLLGTISYLHLKFSTSCDIVCINKMDKPPSVDYLEHKENWRMNGPHQRSSFIYEYKMARLGFVELAKYPSGWTHDQGLMSQLLIVSIVSTE